MAASEPEILIFSSSILYTLFQTYFWLVPFSVFVICDLSLTVKLTAIALNPVVIVGIGEISAAESIGVVVCSKLVLN